MEDKKFANDGELMTFMIAFLTTVIIVSCYHFGCIVVDILKHDNYAPEYSVVHHYHHNADGDGEEEEEKSEESAGAITFEDNTNYIALNH